MAIAPGEAQRAEFYRIAAQAIKEGKLTAQERDIICRPGTRKAGYWGNHLNNLKSYLADKERRAQEAKPNG